MRKRISSKILLIIFTLILLVFNSCYINVVDKVKEDIVFNYKFKLLKEPSNFDPTIELILQKIPTYKKITYEKYDKFSHKNTSLVGSVFSFLAFSGVYGIWQQKEDPTYQKIFYISAGVLVANLLYFLFSEDLDEEATIKKSLVSYEVIESIYDEKIIDKLVSVEKSKIEITIMTDRLNIKKQINDGRLTIDLLKDFGIKDFSSVDLRMVYKKDFKEFQDRLSCTKYLNIKRDDVKGFPLESSQRETMYFKKGTKLFYLSSMRIDDEIYYSVKDSQGNRYAIKFDEKDFDIIYKVEIY